MIVRLLLAAAVAGSAIAAANPAAALPTFDFDTVQLNGGTGNNAAVQTYLNNAVGVGVVTVYGAVAQQTYNGDGHANTDPLAGPNHNRSVTLGTTNGATSPTDYTHFHTGYDTFITNVGGDNPNSKYGQTGNEKIVFVFKAPIYYVSFDWEIFPDGACNKCSSSSSNYPDLELWAGTATTMLYDFDATQFPVSAPNGYPQGLGHFSAVLPQGVTRLEFVDWPQMIGIDKLDPTTVPEPESFSLFGVALAALGYTRRRRLVGTQRGIRTRQGHD
jgi:hypothetical protein